MEILSDIYLSDEGSFASLEINREDKLSRNEASGITNKQVDDICPTIALKENAEYIPQHADGVTRRASESSTSQSSHFYYSPASTTSFPFHSAHTEPGSTQPTSLMAATINSTTDIPIPPKQDINQPSPSAPISEIPIKNLFIPKIPIIDTSFIAMSTSLDEDETHEKTTSSGNLLLELCYKTSNSFPQTFDPDQEILEVTDYRNRSSNNDTAEGFENGYCSGQSSEYEDDDHILDSLSIESNDLEHIRRDGSPSRIPHVIERNYDSSSGSSSFRDADDSEDLYESLSSCSSEREFVRDQTYFWILHGIRTTYSCSPSSEQCFVEAEIETLDSDGAEQDNDDHLDSLASDSSDLEFVRQDEAFVRISHQIRNTYSSDSSSEESFVEAEIETLPSSDGVNTDNSADQAMNIFREVNLGTIYEQAYAKSGNRGLPKYGDEDLESWSSSDFLVIRDCEGWPQIPSETSRSYSSYEDIFDTLDAHARDNSHEAKLQNSAHWIRLMGRSEQTEMQLPESKKQDGAEAVNDSTSENAEDMQGNTSAGTESEPKDEIESDKPGLVCHFRFRDPRRKSRAGVSNSTSINVPNEHCSTCGKSVEPNVPPPKQTNVLKTVGRLFLGKCFGQASDRFQACTC